MLNSMEIVSSKDLVIVLRCVISFYDNSLANFVTETCNYIHKTFSILEPNDESLSIILQTFINSKGIIIRRYIDNLLENEQLSFFDICFLVCLLNRKEDRSRIISIILESLKKDKINSNLLLCLCKYPPQILHKNGFYSIIYFIDLILANIFSVKSTQYSFIVSKSCICDLIGVLFDNIKEIRGNLIQELLSGSLQQPNCSTGDIFNRVCKIRQYL